MRRTTTKPAPKTRAKRETKEQRARRLLEQLERIRRKAAANGRHPDAVTTIREIRSGR